MEINEIRPFFIQAMSVLGQLHKAPVEDEGYRFWRPSFSHSLQFTTDKYTVKLSNFMIKQFRPYNTYSFKDFRPLENSIQAFPTFSNFWVRSSTAAFNSLISLRMVADVIYLNSFQSRLYIKLHPYHQTMKLSFGLRSSSHSRKKLRSACWIAVYSSAHRSRRTARRSPCSSRRRTHL